jgi:carboxypeptidase Q
LAVFQAQRQESLIDLGRGPLQAVAPWSKRSRVDRFFPVFAIGLFLILIFGPAVSSIAQIQGPPQKYADIAEKIRVAGLTGESAHPMLRELTTKAGPRLSGSPQAAAAVALTRKMMQDMGFQTWLEPTMVQHWVRGVETAEIADPLEKGSRVLSVTALGWSIPTPDAGITAQVLEVRSFEELQRLGAQAKGKIVFFNKRMDPAPMDTFRAYGEAAQYRTRGAIEAAKVGAIAVLVRSMTLRTDDHPHAGMVQYDPKIPKIPAAALSTQASDRLSERLQKGHVLSLNLKLGCREFDPVASSNVVGQITGSERPKEIILLGAHLDSWDLATGAHDDGAGCVQVMESLRLIKEQGLKPKRTIRAVLFMNEEFGSSGGRDYAVAPGRKNEKHLAAMESDRGGFLPLGFGIGGSPEVFEKLRKWDYLLKPSGILWVRPEGGGSDISPLIQQGTVPLGFVPDSQRYFDVHHSSLDVLESVHPRELELGAVVMAIFAYILAQEGI